MVNPNITHTEEIHGGHENDKELVYNTAIVKEFKIWIINQRSIIQTGYIICYCISFFSYKIANSIPVFHYH